MPARLVARTVIVLVPTSSGIAGMLQLFVPEAVPDPPMALVHVTAATPALSRAVPLTEIELAAIETVVRAGETIVRLGGVVSLPVTAEYVTWIVRTVVAPFWANAVIVMVLTPFWSVIGPVLQLVVPTACPPPAREFDHITRPMPEGLDAVPESDIVFVLVLNVGPAGAVISSCGPDADGVAGSACRVTVIVRTACVCRASLAVTVTVLEPMLSGTGPAVQLLPAFATPENPRSDVQLTWMSPDPPEVVPWRINEPSVETLGWSIVRSSVVALEVSS